MEIYPKHAYTAVKRAIKATHSNDIEKICQNLEEQARRKNKCSAGRSTLAQILSWITGYAGFAGAMYREKTRGERRR